MPILVQKNLRPKAKARLIAEEIRDMLLSLPDNERAFIISDPRPGQHRIISMRRNASGNPEYDYEQVPE